MSESSRPSNDATDAPRPRGRSGDGDAWGPTVSGSATGGGAGGGEGGGGDGEGPWYSRFFSGGGGGPWYTRFRTYVLAAVVLGLVIVAGVSLAYWRIYSTATIPSPDELALPDPTVVFDAQGEQIARLDPAAVRKNVELENLPEHLTQAVMAAEDRNFREHEGWSFPAILRAAWANLRHGGTVQGASTITQQYVELAVEDVDQSYLGKFREIAIAAKLDDELSKDQILEFYLNTVPYGRGAQGIEAAAQTYFGVSATELTLNQSATLAGMIAAPSAFDPGRHPDRATSRRNFVYDGMVEMGVLEPSRAEELKQESLPDIRTDPLVEFGPDAYFLDAVRDVVPALVDDERENVFTGLRIYTTMDQRIQQLGVQMVDEVLTEAEVPYSGAIVTIDPASGAVRAVVGGRGYEEQQFNVAVEGTNQVGSSFKTFTLTEFVSRGFDPRRSTVKAPETLELESAGGTAEIRNYSRRGYGTVTVETATISSINTAYMNLALEMGIEEVVSMAEALGIDGEMPTVPAVAIGAADLTPLDMASAYATLAGQGVQRQAYLIQRIETHDGEVLFEQENPGAEVIDANTAAVVTDTLRGVVRSGTGTAAALEDHPVAGKTGTTNDNRDAWFVGYTPQLATAVWVGTLDNSPMEDVTGGSLPAELWGRYMAEVMAPFEPAEFPEPDYSGLEARYGIDGDPDTEDDETETESPSPTPSPTPCPGAEGTEPAGTECPTGTESPSPTPSPTPSVTVSPSPTSVPLPTETSSPSPSPSPSPTSSPSPSPTDGGGGDGDTSGSGGSSSPSPSESPSG